MRFHELFRKYHGVLRGNTMGVRVGAQARLRKNNLLTFDNTRLAFQESEWIYNFTSHGTDSRGNVICGRDCRLEYTSFLAKGYMGRGKGLRLAETSSL